MLRRRLLLLAFACLATVGVADSEARAQSTGSSSGGSTNGGSESINSPVPNPDRWMLQNGQYVDVTNNPRPQNLNPTGVNYTDCMQDLQLRFQLNISGFSGSHVEVWAGTIDCTQDANRNQISTATAHPCWPVAAATGPLNAVTTAPLQYTVYARDVLRYEPPPTTGVSQQYQPAFHSGAQGPDACRVQPSDAAVQINVYFIPINSSLQATGTAYQYPLNTDLVAPPPPPSVTLQAGDTLLTAVWTNPGADPDINGFAVWSDPPASGSTTGGCSCGSTPGNGANSYIPGDGSTSAGDVTMYRCIDATADSETDGEVEGSAADGPEEAMESGAVEASMPEAAGPEASMPEASMPEASTDGALDAAVSEGGTGSSSGSSSSSGGGAVDAGDGGMMNCNPINVGGGGACNSYALTANSFVVGGGSSVFAEGGGTPVYDDAGNVITGAEGGETLGGGGIASIDPKYKAGEIDDRTATQLTLTGLANGHNVVVVVTSIDGSGNVGPVSTPQCGQPEPTSDFWKTYKGDNGSAAGCALEAGDGSSSDLPLFAFGIAVTGAAFIRRRRTRR